MPPLDNDNEKSTILIFGASGMVGYGFCREALSQGWNVLALGRQDRYQLPGVRFKSGDVRDDNYLREVFATGVPDLVVNLVANTDHRDCENHPCNARDLHAVTAAKIAALASSRNAKHVHISSEAVYGDLGAGPRVETELCKPKGVYATTKMHGELAVLDVNPWSLVLRCTPVGIVPDERRSLAGWLLGEFRAGRPLTGFGDWIFSPVETASLARLLLTNFPSLPSGIYNWGASKPMSKLMFAQELACVLGFPQNMVLGGLRFDDGSHLDVSLNSTLFATQLGILPPEPVDIFKDLAKAAASLTYPGQ